MSEAPTLSVIIPTFNAAPRLESCLAALGARALGSAVDIIIVDGGSTDQTADIADDFDVRWIDSPRGRGIQLQRGAEVAPGEWLLFLHADTVLAPKWQSVVDKFMTDPGNRQRAAVFKFTLDDPSSQARHLEAMVAWRTHWLGLPYGDQGLLVHRELYQKIGGYRPIPLMEDVAIVRQIGRSAIVLLDVTATTSAARYRHDGWRRRSARNLACLALYYCGLPPRLIEKIYV
jgi:rSAM/selenodomain-associated transferase 2